MTGHATKAEPNNSAIRQSILDAAKTIVVKVGTNVLSKDDDTLDLDRIESLCDQVLRILDSGRKGVMVSSGAIGAGIGLLGLKHRPKDLPHLQAAAAVGQAHLIRLYNDCLQRRGYHAAQLLLTANDFKNRTRYLNVRNTLNTLFEYKIVPIINENDTVSIAEIKFGDNDQLAAMVTGLMDSPLLVILSVVAGLYDGDPAKSSSKLIPLVESWDDALRTLAVESKSARGTGGMQSKLEAVRIATAVGDCLQPLPATFGKQHHWHAPAVALALQQRHDLREIPQREIVIGRMRQRAAPSIENHHCLRARRDLCVEI